MDKIAAYNKPICSLLLGNIRWKVGSPMQTLILLL